MDKDIPLAIAIIVGLLVAGWLMIGITDAWRPSPEALHASHPSWSLQTCQKIRDGQIWIGMSAEQARESWGRPDRINITRTANGTTEQWIYTNVYEDRYNPYSPQHTWYLYMTNGRLRSYQRY